MSFICEICKKQQPARSKPHKWVEEIRDKTYPIRKNGNKVIDEGGEGWEIVSELDICDNCHAESKAKNARYNSDV